MGDPTTKRTYYWNRDAGKATWGNPRDVLVARKEHLEKELRRIEGILREEEFTNGGFPVKQRGPVIRANTDARQAHAQKALWLESKCNNSPERGYDKAEDDDRVFRDPS